jgi:polysaccharide export outer membrane protein
MPIVILGVAWQLFFGRVVSAQNGAPDDIALRAASAHPVPGDRLVFRLLGEPLFTDTTTVNERGQVAIYKLGLVPVSGIPISRLQETLTEGLAKYIPEPALDVTLLRRVVVNGAVTRPDVYYVDLSTRVRDVIARAGGVTEVGDDHNVSIIRGGQTIPVPDWQRDLTIASDLQSGDQIIVGRRGWIAINAFQISSVIIVVASLLISLHH